MEYWNIHNKLVYEKGYKPIKGDGGVVYKKGDDRILIVNIKVAGLSIPIPVMEVTAGMDVDRIQKTLNATRHTEVKKSAESIQKQYLEKLL